MMASQPCGTLARSVSECPRLSVLLVTNRSPLGFAFGLSPCRVHPVACLGGDVVQTHLHRGCAGQLGPGGAWSGHRRSPLFRPPSHTPPLLARKHPPIPVCDGSSAPHLQLV